MGNAVNSSAAKSGLSGLLGNLQNSASTIANPAASSAATTPLGDLYGAIQGFFGVGAVQDTINTADVTLSWCIMMMGSALGTLAHFVSGAPFGVTIGDVTPLGAGLGFGTTLAGASSGMGGATLAGMGSAAEVGGMSVPAGWAAAAPAATVSDATLAGTGWTSAADEAAVGTGGAPGIMPGMASAGGKSAMGFGGPRYGIKPKVMPKQVFV